MKDDADRHFGGVTQYFREARRLMVFDYDSDETAFHPGPDNPVLFEWNRKNIENYLLVPHAWKAAIKEALFHQPAVEVITHFFKSENLNLPEAETWQSVKANIFKVFDGKKLLFDAEDSLFHRLRTCEKPVILPRETIAAAMEKEDIHQDVHDFFATIQKIVS